MAKRNQLENPIYTEMEEKLNEVGKGMCLAKWTQVTYNYKQDTIIVVTTQEHIK